jgi:hypothetical protein
MIIYRHLCDSPFNGRVALFRIGSVKIKNIFYLAQRARGYVINFDDALLGLFHTVKKSTLKFKRFHPPLLQSA